MVINKADLFRKRICIRGRGVLYYKGCKKGIYTVRIKEIIKLQG